MNNNRKIPINCYKLLQFENIEEYNEFILNIISNFKRYTTIYDYKIDNQNLIFNNNICICNIEVNDYPVVQSGYFYKMDYYNYINNNHYRFIIYKYKYDDLIFYIEKNGDIDLLNNIIKYTRYLSYDPYFKIKKYESIESIDKLNEKISNTFFRKDYFINDYKKFCNKFKIPLINYINDNEYDTENLINLYEDLINNKLLDSDKKLNDSFINICLNNNDEEQYYENTYRYNFLESEIPEIADIYYDKENKLLFNNKTIIGYTNLCFQIIFCLILLKTKPENEISLNFINKYNIDINNFKYVFGIIEKNNKNINIQLKIATGLICQILKKLKIEYYIQFIK